MNSSVIKSDFQAKTYLKRTINLFDYRKFNLFEMMNNSFDQHCSTCSINHQKCHLNPSRDHPKTHRNYLIRYRINHHIIHHIKLFLILIFICLISLNDCARVYKGKKHTTNSPIYFISAPFLPNRPINNFPPSPPLLSSQFSHSSNILQGVYKNLMLTSSTTKSPLMEVTKSLPKEQHAGVSSLNQLNIVNSLNKTEGLQASIANYLLKASANPNSFINKLNANGVLPVKDQVTTKIKLKRKKLNRNSTAISEPARTINVNFSIADLKKTFDTFKQPSNSLDVIPNRVIDRSSLDRSSLDRSSLDRSILNKSLINQVPNQQSFPNNIHLSPTVSSTVPSARLMNRMDSSAPSAISTTTNPFNTKDKSLNILGEIILNSLQSKFHNLPLKFLSNGQPSQVLLNNGLNPRIPHKKIKIKKSQNSRIINLKLKYLSNAQPIRALINPFGINNIKKIKVLKKSYQK